MGFSDRASPEKLLSSALQSLDEIVAFLRARNGLTQDDAEEFASIAKLKLLENDYAILRSFRGESSLRTYLGVVVQRLFLDWRISLWGKWRPSAAARRLGGAAIELERLIRRDGRSRADAVRTVAASHPEWSLSTLEEIAADIAAAPPAGAGASRESSESPADESLPSPDPSAADRLETQETADRLTMAMTPVLEKLTPEDLLIVRMHFQEGLTLASIARALQLDQKTLYTRAQRILNQFREGLLRHGLGARDAARILGRTDVDLGFRIALKKNNGKPAGESVQGSVQP